jgi:hypothetical protein
VNENISMPADEHHEQPNHRSRSLAAVLLATVAAAATWLCFHFFTSPAPQPNAYGQAAELDALLHRDSRFSEVSALCAAGASIIVIAPDTLPPKAKSDLEHFVHRHAAIPNTPVRYIPVGTRPNDSQSKP